MADHDYAPLSAVCVRTLSDKVYEKRKAAAFEIEKFTRECVALNNHVQIRKVVSLLGGEFISSHNPNMRKGALVGLAAVAIALGPEQIGDYTEDLIKPILTCMGDTDSRVRYYACESLYNVTKVSRQNVMRTFNDVYSAMSVAITDADQNVRSATELLLKLTMNIVTENPKFDLDAFVPVLKERMYNKNVFARSFHLAWISALKTVPDSKLIRYLPDILDQLFVILSDDTMEIHSRCQKIMLEFLDEIKAEPEEKVAVDAMVNILVVHAQSQHVTLQIMAAQWILEFVHLSGNKMYPHIAGILRALLPNLVFDDERRRNMSETQYKKIRELSNSVNLNLMKLVRKVERKRQPDSTTQLDLESLIEVLIQQLQRGRVETKLAVFRWIYYLFKICQPRMVNQVDEIFPVLLKNLSDTSDEVVILDIQVLCEICSPENQPQDRKHFKLFLLSLLKLFGANRTLLENKGSFMIRQLCVLLSAEDIYRSFAELLLAETNLKFARFMVETLNTILLTTPELFELRSRLRDLSNEKSRELFTCLYRTWSHSQMTCVALCLMTGCYKHAGDLAIYISELDVTLEMLIELDRLVQLIESPIFTHMRIELLETNANLLRALQCLLMMLPQSTAFKTLRDRLNCVHRPERPALSDRKSDKESIKTQNIDFGQLMDHFKETQNKHMEAHRAQNQSTQLAKGVKILDLSSDEETD